MKVPFINIHIHTERQLTAMLQAIRDDGKNEAIRLTNGQMGKLLSDNFKLIESNIAMKRKLGIRK